MNTGEKHPNIDRMSDLLDRERQAIADHVSGRHTVTYTFDGREREREKEQKLFAAI